MFPGTRTRAKKQSHWLIKRLHKFERFLYQIIADYIRYSIHMENITGFEKWQNANTDTARDTDHRPSVWKIGSKMLQVKNTDTR